MKSLQFIGTVLLGLTHSLVKASAIPAESPNHDHSTPECDETAKHNYPPSCVGVGNTPKTRHCWTPGFTDTTNTYKSWPNTGVVRTYHLKIQNTTCSPDGGPSRVCMLVNGMLPGPTIVADWGDTLRITVENHLQSNGTSMHWHGLRMLNNNIQDGVNGITECALAPGDVKTYEFQVTEHGTSWYHAHFSSLQGEGVWGPIVINGPATGSYDEDLGVMPISDWYHKTSYQISSIAYQNDQAGGRPPIPNSILVNGTARSATGRGTWNKVQIQRGKRYRLRLVNAALQTNMMVNLDGHPFKVIANDFVAIKPYTTTHLQIGIGQRYDVIFTADQKAGNYWFRAVADTLCQSGALGEGRAIFTYKGHAVADPTSTAPPIPFTACLDPMAVPRVAVDVPSKTFADHAKKLPVGFGRVKKHGNTVLWSIDGVAMHIDPGKPTLEYVAEHNDSIPQSYNVIDLPSNSASTWSYWIIQQLRTNPPVAHPIHLHGHDFSILGQGLDGTFDINTHFKSLQFTNPPRRDVVQLPGTGWVVIAFPTDNPGAWLCHCHIGTHVESGLSLQFLERKQDIKLPAPGSEWYRTCKNWAAYKAGRADYWPQDDSGL
ncbi:laccase [Exserohilum turcicum]|uniref:laccase n=1 Tax=Exserohilum turcicum (strain 28A) TaxID=671987 RepID=R0K9V3_EXST2|nr:uncharacterized protein SETTUDRAFT_117507 [Exserohilum turcica Et28A]EOA85022.1 hypothetical protein SETTUDRAFT_117507 [Exserohilum turcica Et28A]